MSTTALRVLVVDDEPQIRRFLDISLRSQGHVVLSASTGQEGLDRLALDGADVVILDLGLPDLDGRDVLTRLREWSPVPVIVLTARHDEEEKVALLDAGADDYITKPFGIKELMARIRVLMRRPAGADVESAGYDDGVLRIDPVRREVLLQGEALVLSRKEYALLTLLARHAGRVVTQPQLLREVWGPTHEADTHYLRILVGKLRQKLGDNAAQPRWISTEPGVGLRMKPDR